LSTNAAFPDSFNLSLPGHIHGLIPADGPSRCVETEEAKSRIDSAFGESAPLLDDIAEEQTLRILSARRLDTVWGCQASAPKGYKWLTWRKNIFISNFAFPFRLYGWAATLAAIDLKERKTTVKVKTNVKAGEKNGAINAGG